MSAGRADSKSGNQHSRPDDHAFINRVPQRNIDKLFAANETAAEISYGCESCFNGRARISGRRDCVLGDIQGEFTESALVVVAGKIERQMRVPVHEAGRKRGVAEINNLRVRGRWQTASGVDNLVALNNNDAVLDERL